MQPKFYRKVLKNGMTLVFEKRNLPVVSVAFAVRAGGINESLNEKGISHFIEHMLYKGTPKRNWMQITSEIEKNGGFFNGFTSDEITGYYCKMPSEKLNVALDVLIDLIKNPKFDADEIDKERKVIFEEIKMHRDSPKRYVFEEVNKCLYSGTMSMNLAGNSKTLNSINREKIVRKFGEIYQPNNFVMCVVGCADFENLVKVAEKNFSNDKGKILEQKIVLKNSEKVEKRKGIEQANLVFAYHVPVTKDQKSYTARVLSALIAEGGSSRLFSEIREKRNLAYVIYGGSEIGKRFAVNFIYVGTMKENVSKVKKLILNEFEKVSKELDKKELEKVKTQLIGQFHIGMEDSQEQIINLLHSEICGNAKDFYAFEKEIKKVKLEDVKKMASKVKKGNYSFFALVPEL